MRNHKKSVYIAILNQGYVRVELSHLINTIVRRGEYNVYLSYPADKPIDHNRNRIVKDFLEKKEYDYLLMIDNDIIPNTAEFLKMLDHDKDVITPVMFASRQGSIVPLVLTEDPNNVEGKFLYNVANLNGDEGVVEVDSTGTGCMAIKREVLEHPKMRYPFENIYDEDGLRIAGLDLYFCRRVKKLGFKVWVDLNILASHWTETDLKEMYNALLKRDLDLGALDTRLEMKGVTKFRPKKKFQRSESNNKK